jgi:hypothetical protein
MAHDVLYDIDEELSPMAPFREEPETENCLVCGGEVKIMTYRGLAVCGQLHDRVLKGQLSIAQVDEIMSGSRREDGIK